MREHAADGMDMTMMRNESEAVFAYNLSKFARHVDVGWYAEIWFG